MKNLAIKFLFAFALLFFVTPSHAGYYRHATARVATTSPRYTMTMPKTDVKPAATGSGWESIVSAASAFAGLFVAAVPFGIVSIIFGILGVTGNKKLRGLGIAGIIVGTIDLVVGLLIIAAMAAS